MFTDELRAAADDIWAAQHGHPFVRGIGDSSLPVERFAHYIRQDHVFLVDYARLLALGAARAPDVATMRRFAELTQAVLGEELDLHRAAAAELGISDDELAAASPAPGTAAYTDYLLRTAALGDFAELVAALLPCMWGYHEIATRLAAGPQPADPRYARWIAMYAGEDFGALAAWCRDLVDALAAQSGDAGRERMRRAFLDSSRHELAFWDVGWALQR